MTVTRIGGGPARHHGTKPADGSRVVITCHRRFVQKWTSDEGSVSCFDCLRILGKLKPQGDQ